MPSPQQLQQFQEPDPTLFNSPYAPASSQFAGPTVPPPAYPPPPISHQDYTNQGTAYMSSSVGPDIPAGYIQPSLASKGDDAKSRILDAAGDHGFENAAAASKAALSISLERAKQLGLPTTGPEFARAYQEIQSMASIMVNPDKPIPVNENVTGYWKGGQFHKIDQSASSAPPPAAPSFKPRSYGEEMMDLGSSATQNAPPSQAAIDTGIPADIQEKMDWVKQNEASLSGMKNISGRKLDAYKKDIEKFRTRQTSEQHLKLYEDSLKIREKKLDLAERAQGTKGTFLFNDATGETRFERIGEGQSIPDGFSIYNPTVTGAIKKEARMYDDAMATFTNFRNNYVDLEKSDTVGLVKGRFANVASALTSGALYPEVKSYNDLRDGFIARLKSLTGDVGVMTDYDADRIKKLIAGAEVDPRAAKMNFDEVVSIIKEAKGRRIGSKEAKSDSGAKGQQAGGATDFNSLSEAKASNLPKGTKIRVMDGGVWHSATVK